MKKKKKKKKTHGTKIKYYLFAPTCMSVGVHVCERVKNQVLFLSFHFQVKSRGTNSQSKLKTTQKAKKKKKLCPSNLNSLNTTFDIPL